MTDHQESCRMLEQALDMEEKGKVFYDRAASTCHNERCKEIFGMLARQEVVHMARINEIHESLSGGQGWCDWHDREDHKNLGGVFKQMARKHGPDVTADAGDVEALDAGIALEAAGIGFYQERLEQADDPVEKAFLEKMIGEEKEHHATLSDMKLYLQDPSSYFSEKEHSSLDGG